MGKIRMIFALGIWTAVLPYLGFPSTFKNILFSASGLGLVYLGYIFYKGSEKPETKTEEKKFDNFSENHFNGTAEKSE